jgi:hypothetical protein
MSEALFDVLRKVTTATITTILLKKGIRRCWMNGPKPLVSSGERIVGPAFTLRFVPVREDLATPESWASPISTRAAIEEMPEGVIAVADAMGVPSAGIFRRHPVRPHEEAQRRRAGHRRGAARPRRCARQRPAGVVLRHGGAGLDLGQQRTSATPCDVNHGAVRRNDVAIGPTAQTQCVWIRRKSL